MRIFVTGASGHIGSAIVEALVRAGHQVTGLVRDAEKGARLDPRGVSPVIGTLADPASYRESASGHDGYVHAAFEPTARGPQLDRQAIETLLTLAREPRPAARPRFFIYTSGIWVLGRTDQPAAEDAPLDPTPLVAWRPAHERLVLDACGPELRTMIVRPGIVYGGARGIISDLFKDAVNGLIRVVGTGDNRWPCVYDRDLADLYVRLASRDDAEGVYHANDEADERVNDIATAIAGQAAVAPSVRRIPLDEAKAKMGPYALALALDQRVRSPRARALGWAPALRSVAGNAARLFEEWRSEAV